MCFCAQCVSQFTCFKVRRKMLHCVWLLCTMHFSNGQTEMGPDSRKVGTSFHCEDPVNERIEVKGLAILQAECVRCVAE